MAAKRGRPPSGKYNISEMVDIIRAYADEAPVPILKEICYKCDWNYDYIMELQRGNDELSQSIKRLLYKKEAELEKGGLMGTVDKTMAIFSLKQLGWRDRIDIDTTGDKTADPLADMLGSLTPAPAIEEIGEDEEDNAE